MCALLRLGDGRRGGNHLQPRISKVVARLQLRGCARVIVSAIASASGWWLVVVVVVVAVGRLLVHGLVTNNNTNENNV
jgi:hypothetical protein